MVSVNEQLAEAHASCPRCGEPLLPPRRSLPEVQGIQEGAFRPPHTQAQSPDAPLISDSHEGDGDGTLPPGEDFDPRRELSPSWGIVSSGLSLVLYGTVAVMIAAVALVLLLVMTMVMARRTDVADPEPTELGGVALLCLGIFLNIALIVVAGQCMFCAVPKESQARGPAVGAALGTVMGASLVILSMGLEPKAAAARRPRSSA
jgi:hypothetical protein